MHISSRTACFCALLFGATVAGQRLVSAKPARGAGAKLKRVEALYHDARYEDALEALGPTCRGPRVAACEQLRGLIFVGLGDLSEAKGAFARMLAAEPGINIGVDVSPKIRSMIESVKQGMQGVQRVELEPPMPVKKDEPVLLEIKNPEDATLKAITIFIARPGAEKFEPVSLTLQGGVWSGGWPVDLERDSTVKYYLNVVLPGDVNVPVGSASVPKLIEVEVDRPPSTAGPSSARGLDGEGDGNIDEEPVAAAAAGGSGLPEWGWWAIVGGGAVVLATGVALAIVLTRDPAPGSIKVGIGFEED